MNDTLQKHLEYEFHSASYHTMVEVVIALRTAAGHLVKVPPTIYLCHFKKICTHNIVHSSPM